MKRFSVAAVFVMLAGVATFAQGKAEDGKAAYATFKCGTCHAIGGTGGKLASSLDGVATKLKADEIKKWLTDPAAMEKDLKTKPKMFMSAAPSYKAKTLKPADIDNLAAYMATLK